METLEQVPLESRRLLEAAGYEMEAGSRRVGESRSGASDQSRGSGFARAGRGSGVDS